MPEYDGLHEVEIIYGVEVDGVTLTHHHTFDVKVIADADPGAVFENVELQEKSGLSVFMGTFIQDYMDVWSPLLGTDTALQEIILWKYDDEPSTSKIFIASATTLPTTSFAGTSRPAQGAIFTFRIQGYRYPMRMYVMEGNNTTELRVPYGLLSGANLAYADYVVDPASPIVGRSNGYAIAAIALNAGQNEKLRNLRYRR